METKDKLAMIHTLTPAERKVLLELPPAQRGRWLEIVSQRRSERERKEGWVH